MSTTNTTADPSKGAAAAAAAAASQPAQQSAPRTTFYRRPLPPDLIAFSSPEGRALFREALADGGMEAFFPLSEHFHTQSDPAFCTWRGTQGRMLCSFACLSTPLDGINHRHQPIRSQAG